MQLVEECDAKTKYIDEVQNVTNHLYCCEIDFCGLSYMVEVLHLESLKKI